MSDELQALRDKLAAKDAELASASKGTSVNQLQKDFQNLSAQAEGEHVKALSCTLRHTGRVTCRRPFNTWLTQVGLQVDWHAWH